MSGTVTRIGHERQRMEAALAMARAHLDASRGARRLKLSDAEAQGTRHQAWELATSALDGAISWNLEDVANAALNLVVEIHLESGQRPQVQRAFADLLDHWGRETLERALSHPFDITQLIEVREALEQRVPDLVAAPPAARSGVMLRGMKVDTPESAHVHALPRDRPAVQRIDP